MNDEGWKHPTSNSQRPISISRSDGRHGGNRSGGQGRGEDGELRMAKSGAERFFHERFDKTGKQCEGAFRFGSDRHNRSRRSDLDVVRRDGGLIFDMGKNENCRV